MKPPHERQRGIRNDRVRLADAVDIQDLLRGMTKVRCDVSPPEIVSCPPMACMIFRAIIFFILNLNLKSLFATEIAETAEKKSSRGYNVKEPLRPLRSHLSIAVFNYSLIHPG